MYIFKALNYLEKLPTIYFVVINLLIVVSLGFIDYVSGEDFSFFIFYLIPIILISWYSGRKAGYYMSIFSTLAWTVAKILNAYFYSSDYIFIGNLLIRFIFFIAIAYLITQLKSSQVRINELDRASQKEKTIIKTTQNMVGLIAEHITINNSEIINWINNRRNNGKQVPERVERASLAIGQSLRALTEVSFMGQEPGQSPESTSKYFELFKERLDKLVADDKYKNKDD